MIKGKLIGTTLAVQWLKLHASTEGSMGLIPGQGGKRVCLVMQPLKKRKEN